VSSRLEPSIRTGIPCPEPPLVVLLAGGQGQRLSILSEERAKPAVPFGGAYRIIDFPLSNCVNSGFYDILILAQYRPRSLDDHIGVGKPWDLDRAFGGVEILQPYPGRAGLGWYRGTADAVCQNFQTILARGARRVLILAGDHVYKMDYRAMVAFHEAHHADVTIGVVPVAGTEARQMGILTLAEDGRILEFEEKPEHPRGSHASMGIYLFETEFLRRVLRWDDPGRWRVDFGHEIIPKILGRRVYGYPFDGYWLDIGTIDSYYRANMDLLQRRPRLDLLDRHWLIYTHEAIGPPAHIRASAEVDGALVASGSIVSGRVVKSVLFPGVVVEEGATVEGSILMAGCHVGRGAVVRRAILDKQVRVGEHASVGARGRGVPNRRFPQHLSSGLTLVGKRSVIPSGVRVGGNCLVGPKVGPSLWVGVRDLPNGDTLTSDAPAVSS
jgi:glucose-1-phosphate adenylyltransferase